MYILQKPKPDEGDYYLVFEDLTEALEVKSMLEEFQVKYRETHKKFISEMLSAPETPRRFA